MPQIIDTPAVETVSPFAKDIETLIGAGEGKSLTYDESDGITDEKTAESLKIKFQRAANAVDRTARAKVSKSDDGKFTVTFTLKPKQKTRTAPTADAAPAADEDGKAGTPGIAAVLANEDKTAAPKPRGK